MSKPKINKIVIEVAGKKLEFTPDEAKELKTLLNDLFGHYVAPTVIYRDRYPYLPSPWTWYSTSMAKYQGGTFSGSLDANSQTLCLSTKAA